MIKRKIALIPLALSIFLMILIFFFSSQSGENSSELSIKATRLIAQTIVLEFDTMHVQRQNTIVDELHGFVRKSAHFSIYTLLGLNVFFTAFFVVKCLKNQIIIAMSVCTAYACLDEFHQLFREGREASIKDVLIDVCGVGCGITTGVIVISIVFYIKSKNRQNGSL